MSPTHTQNHGRRYTYYASNMNGDAGAPALRLPASEIEQAIRRAVAKWLRTDANIQKLAASKSADEKKAVFGRAKQLADDIEHLPISSANLVLSEIGLSISVSDQLVVGRFNPAVGLRVAATLDAEQVEASVQITLDQQNYGHEPRLRLQPSEPDRVVKDNRLVELLGRAFAARDELLQMDEETVRSARTTRLRHLQRLAKLSYLDPTIIRSILSGTHPKNLSARSLWRIGDLPIRFADQREALGFSNS